MTMRSFAFALAAALTPLSMVFAQQVQAQQHDFGELLAADTRLATVAERLLAANAALCRQQMPLTGFVIHSQDQYSADAASMFANGPVTIALVLPDSPAAVAGLNAADGIQAIDAQSIADLHVEDGEHLRDSVFEMLAAAPAKEPMRLTVVREGSELQLDILPEAGCRALTEIRVRNSLGARSDGRVIQVNYGLATAADDEALAVIFAHELGHLVLEHRRRLSSAGVSKGFFGEFGRNQQLNRQVEVEADRMSVHLLANAGYDPAIAPAFWRSSLARRAAGGLMRSSTYPSPEARARLVEREIADYLGGGVIGPSWPGHLLAKRDESF